MLAEHAAGCQAVIVEEWPDGLQRVPAKICTNGTQQATITTIQGNTDIICAR
jgi:hypothetical protein